MVVTFVSLVVGALFIWVCDIHQSWQQALAIFVSFFCFFYLAWYRRYTKSLMRKTGTHPGGKPLSQQEREGLSFNGLIMLQCGRCGHILRDQSPEKIHTRCTHKKCGGVLHDVTGFVD